MLSLIRQIKLLYASRGALWREPVTCYCSSVLLPYRGSRLLFAKGVSIGRYTIVEAHSSSVVSFEENVYIGDHCIVRATEANITFGANTIIGHSVQIYSANHAFRDKSRLIRDQHISKKKGVVVGKDCWLGGGVIVLPGVTIGEGAVVGAGSVVTKSVAPYTVVAGNPARQVGFRE